MSSKDLPPRPKGSIKTILFNGPWHTKFNSTAFCKWTVAISAVNVSRVIVACVRCDWAHLCDEHVNNGDGIMWPQPFCFPIATANRPTIGHCNITWTRKQADHLCLRLLRAHSADLHESILDPERRRMLDSPVICGASACTGASVHRTLTLSYTSALTSLSTSHDLVYRLSHEFSWWISKSQP